MYYNEQVDDVIKKLGSNKLGLSDVEIKLRIEKYGKNQLPKKKRKSIFKMFIEELTSPIEIILVITVIISLIVGEVVDALVILFIILLDVFIGVYQENKALKTTESISNMLKTKNRVIRNNKECEIDSEELVIGDIVLFESGSKITADCRIIECNNLQVDESVLTGESIAEVKSIDVIEKKTPLADRTNMLFAGCNVVTGRCKAIVVETGVKTQIGIIANQVALTQEEKTPLTIRMQKFTKQISIIIIVIAFISAMILYLKNYEINTIFLSVIALAVSAMPEGLSLALTMALTIASNRMSKKGVIVKNLNSVEALGSCTIIASDKTGTLTVNEQTVRKIVLPNDKEVNITGTGYNEDGEFIFEDESIYDDIVNIVNLGAINNEASFIKENDIYTYSGDSIDIAFLVMKEKLNVDLNYLKKEMIPYESEKQYSAVFYEKNGKLRCCVKGSLEKVMLFSDKKEKYVEQNKKLSKQGYRVIAICDGEVDGTKEKDIKKLNFLGMVAFIDPIREEAYDSIKEARLAGIKVVMITGDHPLTALSIGKELEIANSENDVITGNEIEEAYNKGEFYFDNIVKNKTIFSRVTPTDKFHIIESYKRLGQFVAVTGDGVNDAPAIKCANIGISMGSGTDVAKETSDMIILDDNFKSIVSGIKEGRIAYANIRKIVLFLLSCGIAEVLFYLFAVGFGYPIPLIAIQLLWINIVTDGIQDMALSFETSSTDVMNEKPRNTKESLFNKDLIREVLIFGVTISIMIFTVWKYLIDKNIDIIFSRSIIMLLMVYIQNIHVLNCRSEQKSIFKTSLKSNPLVIITIIGSIILQLVVTNIPFLANFLSVKPLPFNIIILTFIFSLTVILVAEIYKVIYRKNKHINK